MSKKLASAIIGTTVACVLHAYTGWLVKNQFKNLKRSI